MRRMRDHKIKRIKKILLDLQNMVRLKGQKEEKEKCRISSLGTINYKKSICRDLPKRRVIKIFMHPHSQLNMTFDLNNF